MTQREPTTAELQQALERYEKCGIGAEPATDLELEWLLDKFKAVEKACANLPEYRIVVRDAISHQGNITNIQFARKMRREGPRS